MTNMFPNAKFGMAVAIAVASFGLSAATAQASPVSSYFTGGYNLVEDDSNEYIFRATDNGYEIVTTGNIQVGDVLAQILDFPIINGTNIDSAGLEFTGIALNVVTNLSPTKIIDPIGPIPAYTAVDITFGAASADQWLGLTGINLGSYSFDTTGLISLLFGDTSNDLNINTQAWPASVGTATNGDLLIALALSDLDDYLVSADVPLDIGVFAPDGAEVPGVTTYGTFGYQLSVAYEGLPGSIISDVDGSGTNLVTNRPSIAAVIDDTQASFQYVPEPGSLALLGIGFLGLSAVRRIRRS